MSFTNEWDISNPQDNGRVRDGAAAIRGFRLDFRERINVCAPIGIITPWPLETAPDGWMECAGASLLRSSYPTLFSVIGTTFGAADGTHFNIPDLRGLFPRSLDSQRGRDLDLYSNTITGRTVAGSAIITDIAGLGFRPSVGDIISGSGIPNGTTIVSMNGTTGAPTEITMSTEAVGFTGTIVANVIGINTFLAADIEIGENEIWFKKSKGIGYVPTVGSIVSGWGIPAGTTITSVTVDSRGMAVTLNIDNDLEDDVNEEPTFSLADRILGLDRWIQEDVYIVIEDKPMVTTTNGSPTLVVASGLSVRPRIGSAITGTGIPANTKITALTGQDIPTSITISQNATASATVQVSIDGTGIGTTQDSDNPSHSHTVHEYEFPRTAAGGKSGTFTMPSGNAPATGGNEFRPKNTAMMFIIRTDEVT